MNKQNFIKKTNCSNSACGTVLTIDMRKVRRDKPLVRCKKCGELSKILISVSDDTVVTDEATSSESKKKLAGWLIVHDENTDKQTHPIKTGSNIVGRFDENKPCDIMIKTTDRTMSRNHCKLEARVDKNGKTLFHLSDYCSLNGTFINGNEEKIKLKEGEILILNDDDTLQLGRTKFIIKSAKTSANSAEAEEKVARRPYGKTVII